MKLLVLGGTGATGRQLVAQALERGHDVAVLVRDPGRLTFQDPRLHVHTGDATDAVAVEAALDGAAAVLSALGTRDLRALFSTRLISHSTAAVVTAMQRRGVRRIVMLSALGAGASVPVAPVPLRLAFRTVFRAVGRDKAAGETLLRSSGLDWTTVHPPSLSDAPPAGGWNAGPDLRLRGVPKLSRADVAAFMLDQAVDPRFVGQAVVLGPR